MRDPNNIIDLQMSDKTSTENLDLRNLDIYEGLEYDLLDERERKKYFTDVEKEIRNSFEYKQLIKFLREYMNMNQCSFYERVSNQISNKIRIEIHHDPLSLYDITIIVFNKRNFHNESLDVEDVALEVMYLHYILVIGLIPLSQTVHELVHNMYLFIPTDIVLGNYRWFVNTYEKFMSPEQIDILDRIEEATMQYNTHKNILNKKYVYLDLHGEYALPTTKTLQDILTNTIETNKKIKNVKEFPSI